LENPALKPATARWAALTTNAHYYPFLSARLTGGRWYDLGSGEPGDEKMLGLFPLDGPNRREVQKWVAVHPYFHRLARDIAQINLPRTYTAAKAELDQGPALVEGDRFLESCYWETAAQFYYGFDYRHHFDDLAGALRHAAENGYGAAHLYYKLGSLYLQKRNFEEAKKGFEKALRVEPRYQDALDGEALLQRMKQGKD
jgi:tetratricopeptide (TPR) repeat protein